MLSLPGQWCWNCTPGIIFYIMTCEFNHFRNTKAWNICCFRQTGIKGSFEMMGFEPNPRIPRMLPQPLNLDHNPWWQKILVRTSFVGLAQTQLHTKFQVSIIKNVGAGTWAKMLVVIESADSDHFGTFCV